MPTFYIGFCHYQLHQYGSYYSYEVVLFKVESEVSLNLDIVMKKKLVLYQPLLRKLINLRAQLARQRVWGPSLFFLKVDKKYPDTLCASMGSVFICNAVLRVSWRRNTKITPCGALLLHVANEVFIEVPLFQEISFAQKNSWLRACILLFILTFIFISEFLQIYPFTVN